MVLWLPSEEVTWGLGLLCGLRRDGQLLERLPELCGQRMPGPSPHAPEVLLTSPGGAMPTWRPRLALRVRSLEWRSCQSAAILWGPVLEDGREVEWGASVPLL